MVKIVIFYDEKHRVSGFEAKGHAMGPGRADKYDLICCAVSVLTITTVNGITECVKVKIPELKVDDGYMKCMLRETDSLPGGDEIQNAQIDALLESMVLGLQELAQDHPKFVQLEKRRWTS